MLIVDLIQKYNERVYLLTVIVQGGQNKNL